MKGFKNRCCLIYRVHYIPDKQKPSELTAPRVFGGCGGAQHLPPAHYFNDSKAMGNFLYTQCTIKSISKKHTNSYIFLSDIF